MSEAKVQPAQILPQKTRKGIVREPKTDQGNTDQGNTDQGNTDQGNTDLGNTDQGNTNQGNTDSTGPTSTKPKMEISTDSHDRWEATKGHDRGIKLFRDWLAEHPQESEADKEKRLRRERSKRIIGAVSDGLAAMSNLWFTSQYAPNMYNHEKTSLRKSTDERIERMKAEREKDRDQYMRYSLELGNLEKDRAKTLRDLEAQREARELARKEDERKAEQHYWLSLLQPDKQRKGKGEADKAEYDALSSQRKAENMPESLRLDNALKEAGIKQRNAIAVKAYADAASKGDKDKHRFMGKDYVSTKDYEKDVTEAARKYNERHGKLVIDYGADGKPRRGANGATIMKWEYEEGFVPIRMEREEQTAYGKRTKARRPEEYAGEVESRLKEEAEEAAKKAAEEAKKKAAEEAAKKAAEGAKKKNKNKGVMPGVK